MKRFLIALALVAAPACTTIPTPSTVANQTVLDEKVGLAVETAYAAAARSAALAIRAGLITDVAAVERLRARAYAAVLATRAAYDAGNATSFDEAARLAISLIAQINNTGR